MADSKRTASQAWSYDNDLNEKLWDGEEDGMEDNIFEDVGQILWDIHGDPSAQVDKAAKPGKPKAQGSKKVGFEQLEDGTRAYREEGGKFLMDILLGRPDTIFQPVPRAEKHIPWLQDSGPDLFVADGLKRSEARKAKNFTAWKCRQRKKESVQRLETQAREAEEKNTNLRMELEHSKQDLSRLQEEIAKHNRCDNPTVKRYLKSMRLATIEHQSSNLGEMEFEGDNVPHNHPAQENPGPEPRPTSDGTVATRELENNPVGTGEIVTSPSVKDEARQGPRQLGTVGRGYIVPSIPGQTLPNGAIIDARFDVHGDNGQNYVASTIFVHGFPRLSSLQVGQRVSFRPLLAQSIQWAVDVLLVGDEHNWRAG